jgi:hypothetical protein
MRAFLGAGIAIPRLNEELVGARSKVYKTYTSDEATPRISFNLGIRRNSSNKTSI